MIAHENLAIEVSKSLLGIQARQHLRLNTQLCEPDAQTSVVRCQLLQTFPTSWSPPASEGWLLEEPYMPAAGHSRALRHDADLPYQQTLSETKRSLAPLAQLQVATKSVMEFMAAVDLAPVAKCAGRQTAALLPPAVSHVSLCYQDQQSRQLEQPAVPPAAAVLLPICSVADALAAEQMARAVPGFGKLCLDTGLCFSTVMAADMQLRGDISMLPPVLLSPPGDSACQAELRANRWQQLTTDCHSRIRGTRHLEVSPSLECQQHWSG